MAEEYNVQAIVNDLRMKEELDPDQHDGCYEILRETVEAYSKLPDFSVLDYKDLNHVYLITVGTWSQGLNAKKKMLEESHLLAEDKENLTMLWDDVWEKAGRGEYGNYEASAKEGRSIGLFGTGFFSFKRKGTAPTSEQVQSFIRMLIDIVSMTNDDEIFNRAEGVLNVPIPGMQAAAASMILHCLKPYTFPILNANTGFRNIFEVIGVQLKKPSNLDTYVENCRNIKAFRDQNFTCKNYRIFDIAAQNLNKYSLAARYGKFGAWEIISEHVARIICDMSFFQNKGAEIPQAVRWFFEGEDSGAGEKVNLVLEHDGFEYDASIEKTDNGADQTRIFWDAALAEEFDPYTNDGKQHVLQFSRTGDYRYAVEFLELETASRVWLITWNKNNWYWENFTGKCEATKAGETFVESWACANSNPQIGEEVFLIKLGEQPRGIIGHGIVERTIYEKAHYDAIKAAEGKTEKAIDVRFDRLINYEKEKYISQDELNAKCAEQHWSPQNSGIEIKQEVLPNLRALWEAVIQDDQKDDYWPSAEEYPVNLSKDDWKHFIQEVEYPKHKGCMRVLACYVDIGGIASPKTLADKYKGHPSVYTSSVLNTSRRALQFFNMEPCPDGDTQRYFPIAFLGHKGKDVNPGTYEYKMRPELLDALRELDLSSIDLIYGEKGDEEEMSTTEFNHNLILYGPPGTGKTYNSVIYAVSICEGRPTEEVGKEPYGDVLIRYNELRDAGRVAFTTFHQSYGYEEFIEGIKPKLDADSDSIGYTIEDGVFKDFCNRAKAIKVRATAGAQMKEKPRIWGMILGGTGMTELKKQCFEHNEICLGWTEVEDKDIDGAFIGDDNASWNAKHMVSDFKNVMEIGDIVVVEKNNKSIDAIGIITGEYVYDESRGRYPRSRSVEWLVKDIDQDMVPFLPNGRKQLSRFSVFAFDYIGMDTITQILNEYTSEHVVEVEKETKPYVFIIDEINRGHISKIFGELITLIEDTKRAGATEAMEAILPYSGEVFSVPDNVYILGTMNTADRSIALMDTALRRRFGFIEMMPDSEVLESLGVGMIAIDGEELNVAAMLDVINQRIEYLFDREHTIGHAFFTKLADDLSLDTLAGIFENNVIPLLQEYFYEDYEKIQLVLGDNAKEDEFKFILDKPLKLKDIFSGNPDIDLPEKGYSIQHDAFYKLASYKQIGKDL